jgi:hypothetical protein
MNDIYIFLIRNDIWIYIVCTFGLFWYLTQFVSARQLLRKAMFGLERETGNRLLNSAVVFLFVFAAIIGFVIYVNAQIAPNLPEELLKPPTHTPDVFATRLASPTPLGTPEAAPPTPTFPLVPTVTLAGDAPVVEAGGSEDTAVSPNETPTPAIILTPTIDCTPRLNFASPRDGSAVSELITFSGTADTENFQFYTIEANGPQTNGQWASLLGRNIDQPVTDGFMGQANLQNWSPGPYLIRLTAVDTTNNATNLCIIQVTLN